MRILVQACSAASVEINSEIVAQIGQGELLLVAFKPDDTPALVDKMIGKLLKIRIFPDTDGKTNLSLSDFGGDILAVSQFTLYGGLKEGNRPSYNRSMNANDARKLFSYFQKTLSASRPTTRFGVFQAEMNVTLTNVGPTTYLLDSEELFGE